MGVEPTRDRAERPLSRFEDGETHRGPYTSIKTWRGHPSPFMGREETPPLLSVCTHSRLLVAACGNTSCQYP